MPTQTAEIKKGVAPVADNEIAVIEMEQPAFGTIKIELYSNIAPKMVAQFKELAKEGVYNGTTFHRINQSVIQGGDPNSKDSDPSNDGMGNSDKTECSGGIFRYSVSKRGLSARPAEEMINSANSQFFIMIKRESGFDNRYTVFGKVIEGINNVQTISGVPTGKSVSDSENAGTPARRCKNQADNHSTQIAVDCFIFTIYHFYKICSRSSVDRVLPSEGRSRRFKSRREYSLFYNAVN